MTKDTKLPPYLPYPRFLLEADMAQAAKLVYMVLLDRATLSQANGWTDEGGRLYLVFPIEGIANAIDRSPMTVKNALAELEAAGLIERQRRGFSAPNRIYVKIPDGQDIVRLMDRKLSVIGKENCPSDGKKTVPMMDRKLSSNHLSNNNLARCSLSSSSVGELWQYFVPNSSRETHRQTMRFLPFLAQVHRLYGVPHSPHTSSSDRAYLAEYLPCSVFPKTRKEMKGLPWGLLFNAHGQRTDLDPKKLELEIQRLLGDEDVTRKSGIYEYLLTGDERKLSIRAFDRRDALAAYERQGHKCAICGEEFGFEEMHADHITAWSKGGHTTPENCQMLCRDCNLRKGSQ